MTPTPGTSHPATFDGFLPEDAQPITADLRIGACDDADFLRTRFVGHVNAHRLDEVPSDQSMIVTGYGPTNAPTVGTLSAMLATKQLQDHTGLPATLIVSDLGAWNSRNIDWPTLEHLRDRILRFLTAIGFNGDSTTLRGHQDHDNLVLAGLIAKLLTEADFRANRESLDELYQNLGLRGSMLGIMVDGLYTIADILGPLREGCTRVLMVAGVEEHYFADLAQLVLTRAAERYPGQLFPPETKAAALFLDVVPGLAGYPKMSKSIPDSAINLGEPLDAIRNKIVGDGRTHPGVLLKMMELASDWSADAVSEARRSFEARDSDPRPWQQARERCAETLLAYAETWAATA
jgi:tryptophanyl-tRNA synthetase